MAALSDTLVRVLDALHLKSAVKRFMRRRAVTVKTDE
jgi:hypothetical protein